MHFLDIEPRTLRMDFNCHILLSGRQTLRDHPWLLAKTKNEKKKKYNKRRATPQGMVEMCVVCLFLFLTFIQSPQLAGHNSLFLLLYSPLNKLWPWRNSFRRTCIDTGS